jgi:hypothetical protein
VKGLEYSGFLKDLLGPRGVATSPRVQGGLKGLGFRV